MTKIKNIALALSAIVLFAANSFAGTPVTKATTIVDEPAAEQLVVNFLGEDENYLIFQVVVKPGANKYVSFTVNDKEDGQIYKSVITVNKTSTFKIEKKDGQELEFNLAAAGKKKSLSKSFTIIPTVTLTKL